MDGPSVHLSKYTTDVQILPTSSMWWTDLDGGPSYFGGDGRKWPDIFGGRSTSWTNSDGGPQNLVKEGRRWTGFLSGPSTPWTDSDGGPRFFIVSGRDFCPDRPPYGRIWTADGHIGLSRGRGWTTGRMDEVRPWRPGTTFIRDSISSPIYMWSVRSRVSCKMTHLLHGTMPL